MSLRSFVREPLVQFLAIGACLFLLFQWRTGGAGVGSNRIVISTGQLASLAAGFEKTWLRPPTDQELKGLIDDYVREEIAVREAASQGLDQGDVVIRRRLRQKYEFLIEDEVANSPPTDAEMQAWLDAHPGQYRRDPVVGFRQVFLNSDRRGASARPDAGAALQRLIAGADPATLGDPTLLPLDVEPSELRDIARQFGNDFAAAVDSLPQGQWSGPVQSGFGLHLVLVTARYPGVAPSLAAVRDQVARDLYSARRSAVLDSIYQRLSGKYRITIERPAADQP